MRVVGIDENGLGPLLGPLVVTAVAFDVPVYDRELFWRAADKILTAIETENEKLLMLMAAYILRTMPGVTGINIDITGDMNETDIIMGHEDSRPLGPIFS